MRGMRGLAVVLAVGAVGTGTALAAGPGGKATGGVNYISNLGLDVHRSFNAAGDASGGRGQVEVKAVDPATGEVVRRFHGVVTCYRQVSGNVAIFSGQITDDQGKASDAVAGQFFEWAVEDNGEGAKAAPDRIAAAERQLTPFDCATDLVPARDVVNGNIQVKAG